MILRTRLLVGMAVVAAVLVIVSAVVTITTRDELIGQIDDATVSVRDTRSTAPPGGAGGPSASLPSRPPATSRVRRSDAFEGYVDADGDLVTLFTPNVGDDEYHPPDITEDDLPASGSRRSPSTASAAAATASSPSPTARSRRSPHSRSTTCNGTIARLVLVEIVGSLAILAVLGLVSWWVMQLGVRPVKRMTATATRDRRRRPLRAGAGVGARGPSRVSWQWRSTRCSARSRRSLAERAASEERLRHFVADASHELRTPVTTIRGYAELYRHGGLGDPAALDDAMRRTEQEAARIGRLVDDMLALARLDERRPLDVRPVDLALLAGDAAADARAASPGRPIDVELDGTPVVVDGDEDRLRQVIANVVGNALVHTVAGRPGDDPRRARRDDGDALGRSTAARA